MSATIHFSDGTTLTIREDDVLMPIVPTYKEDNSFAPTGEDVSIPYHNSAGFIPGLVSFLSRTSFFYLNDNYHTAYCTRAVVRLETDLR